MRGKGEWEGKGWVEKEKRGEGNPSGGEENEGEGRWREGKGKRGEDRIITTIDIVQQIVNKSLKKDKIYQNKQKWLFNMMKLSEIRKIREMRVI